MKRLILATALCFFSALGYTQTKNTFFKDADLMQFGTYYYPEQWPKEKWAGDIKNISKLGFTFTHYGEFAWAAMEPEEGKYDFTWLDEAIRLAELNHLKVILGTPTPAPPVWLTRKHPEILVVTDDGRRLASGGRQYASWSSEIYRKYVAKIVTELAKRYGKNKTVWGWQIDNEPSHYSNAYDYNVAAQQHFRKWLAVKYKNITALNAAWGTTFWSQTYNNFEQIDIPNSKQIGRPANPHAMLDFKRFTADEAADFINSQQHILRQYINKEQWITTNVMPEYSAVDPLRMNTLDFMTSTKYLVAGFSKGTGDQGFRIGASQSIGFATDLIRPISGTVAMMELQPGQVNWGKFTPQPLPGAIRLWTYHVFASGNRFVCNYLYRQPLFGIEQHHNGVVKPDGITPSRSGAEFITAINEMSKLKKLYRAGVKEPAEHSARRTALLYNVDNRWETEHQPQTSQWDFMAHYSKYYELLKAMAAPVDMIDERADFSKYPVLIAPAYQLLDTALISRWKNYVERGGHLVLTTRTGQKDRNAHLWETSLAQPIYSLLGIKDLYYDHLPEDKVGKISLGMASFEWNNWADILIGAQNEDKVAIYADQFYRGETAVLQRKLGKGTVTYVGADTDDGLLENAVLRKLYKDAGIAVMDLPKGMIVEWRDGFWIGLNYSSVDQEVPIPKGSKILIGNKMLPPAGVVVWQDN